MHTPRSSLPGHPTAFSRLDLLVALAMLMVLAIITIPRLARAGAHDREAACLNNQRALALAWSLFASDNNGALVNNFAIAETMATVNQKTYLTWAHKGLGQ